MSRIVVLDAGPLGLVTHRGGIPEVDACKQWLFGQMILGEGRHPATEARTASGGSSQLVIVHWDVAGLSKKNQN